MASSLLHPPAHLPPPVALHLSQQAPTFLQSVPSSIGSYSVSSLFAATETADLWTTYENLMLSCLRTGDENSARLCLDRLTERFGESSERVLALRGIYREATAVSESELQAVLRDYETILAQDASNMPVSKRRVAILRTLRRAPEAIDALNKFLQNNPTDAEGWAELSDLYISQGLYPQGIFALEEVLLITPNAWNMHAKLGEIYYIVSGNTNTSDSTPEKNLVESMRRFSRSIELCDDYLRGYYGLKLVTNKLLQSSARSLKGADSNTPDTATLQKLNQTATAKLAELVRRSSGGEAGFEGYDSAEVIAVQSLLDKDQAAIVR